MNLQDFNIYNSFRPHQEETIQKALDFIHNSNKRYLCIQAPTGSGKSIVAYVLSQYLITEHEDIIRRMDVDSANYSSLLQNYQKSIESAYILTSKNLLLDQYYNDFSKVLPIAKGRVNYNCKLDNRPCSEGICLTSKNKSMECKSRCPYLIAKRKMLESKVSSTNFALMLKMMNLEGYKPRDLVIVDECQALESVLLEEYSIEFTEKTINLINELKNDFEEILISQKFVDKTNLKSIAASKFQFKKCSFKRIDLKHVNLNDKEDVDKFLMSIFNETRSLKDVLSESVDMYIEEVYDNNTANASYDTDLKKMISLGDKFKHLSAKIGQYLKLKDSLDWIVQSHKTEVGKKITGFDIKPVTLGTLTEHLFKNLATKKVIFMSATIGNPSRFAKDLGLPPEEVDFIDVPSTFPIENRPFFIYPVANVNKENIEESMYKITDVCDTLIEGYGHRKGIIHSVSYENAYFIKEHSRLSNRLLMHDQKSKDIVLKEFKESDDKILISPSIIEGFDFKGKLSEFQIFIKVPYLNLKDKVIQKRSKLDPEWYANNAILQILQGTGRSIRSAEDYAETWFLDGNFNRLLQKYKYLFTKDFLNTIQKVD